VNSSDTASASRLPANDQVRICNIALDVDRGICQSSMLTGNHAAALDDTLLMGLQDALEATTQA